MIVEALVALTLIFVSTTVIYALGRKSASKTTLNENEQASYACGEKAAFPDLKINVSLYKYLIYFVIFDSSILLLAFASFSVAKINPFFLILYLSIILAAGLVLFETGKND